MLQPTTAATHVLPYPSEKIAFPTLYSQNERLPDWLQDAIDNVIQHIKDAIESIKDFFTNGFEAAIKKIKELFESASNGIKGLIDELKKKLEGLGDDVECAVEQRAALEELLSTVTKDMSVCVQAAMDKFGEIQAEATKLVEDLMKKGTELAGVVMKCYNESGLGVVTCVIKEIGTIVSDVESIISDAKQLYTYISEIASISTSCISGVVSEAQEQISKISKAIDECLAQQQPLHQ